MNSRARRSAWSPDGADKARPSCSTRPAVPRRVLLRGDRGHRCRVAAAYQRRAHRHARPATPYHFATGRKPWTRCSRWARPARAGRDRRVPVSRQGQSGAPLDHPGGAAASARAAQRLPHPATAVRLRAVVHGQAAVRQCPTARPGRAGAGRPPARPPLAAEFWDITDPRLALQVNAIVGGTPAYRREFARGDTPNGADDFDDWVVRTVLNPETPLFREARYLLAEEPDLSDTALYLSVLAAVADGNATRGGMAAIWSARPPTSHTPSTSSKTPACCTGMPTPSATTAPPTASPNR